jgi:ribokinase
MSTIFVSGLINVETTLRVERFPVPYFPVCYPFFGINTAVSGVGYNVAKALTHLGNTVRFASLIGQDASGQLVATALAADDLSQAFVLDTLEHTAQSVVLYDQDGKRQIHTDLKNIQEQVYPSRQAFEAVADCKLAVLGNINFSRALLRPFRERGILIATDVHAISDPEDAYNRDFMEAAHILFMSHERLPLPPIIWAQHIAEQYGPEILVIGMGDQGALLWVKQDHFLGMLPALAVRLVVNTVGAGDALFSSFIHFYNESGDPYSSLKRATVFASYKIGETGAANGFLTSFELDRLYQAYDSHLQFSLV